jgi:hypothetical protein
MLRAGQNAGGQLFDGLRLVAGGRVIGNEFKHMGKLRPQWSGVNVGFEIETVAGAHKLRLKPP